MVFGSLDGSFGGEGAVVARWGEGDGDGRLEVGKEGSDRAGAFVVDVEGLERVAVGGEERVDGGEGFEVGSGVARGLGAEVDVAFVYGHEDILVTKAGGDRVAAGGVSRSPVAAVGEDAERSVVVRRGGGEAGTSTRERKYSRWGFARGGEVLADEVLVAKGGFDSEGRVAGKKGCGKARNGG